MLSAFFNRVGVLYQVVIIAAREREGFMLDGELDRFQLDWNEGQLAEKRLSGLCFALFMRIPTPATLQVTENGVTEFLASARFRVGGEFDAEDMGGRVERQTGAFPLRAGGRKIVRNAVKTIREFTVVAVDDPDLVHINRSASSRGGC